MDSVKDKMRTMRERIVAALPKAAYTGARVMEQEVEARAPVQTGKLRTAVRIRVRADENGASAMVAVSREAFYWRYQEFGTSKQIAKPFLRPAYEASKDAAEVAAFEKMRALVSAK